MQAPNRGTSNAAAGRTGCLRPRSCTCGTDIVVAAARGSYVSTSALRVPFPSPLEAEIAHGSLSPDVEPHQGVIEKELTVRGNVLAIKWTAEDARLLRISIINCLEHLSLVLRTMQHFGPPISR
ncbi:EKC/KEOPS complex subunit LAGE3 [Sciurus carolinensis]|uniref:L antigen family member 3 n=1 Tax=Sciurus carolinensis TaxID=30640 RepID=A0AA41MP69_SCICA|nr:EKC/KEOPS complex subunit LAGE3 [Sciurus carolinensis]